MKLVKPSGLESRFLTPHQHATGKLDLNVNESPLKKRCLLAG